MHLGGNRRWVPLAEVELAPLITYLINKSIKGGTVPALWKVAGVTSLKKLKIIFCWKTIGPNSVLPILSKVFERVVHTQMVAYLDHLGL